MSHQQSDESLPVEHAQSIFLAVVEAQDAGASVLVARAEIARRFSVTEEQVKDIEREGVANQWPPL